MSNATPWHWTLADAVQVPNESGRASARLFDHGSMNVRYYAPTGKDEQVPHDQDEIYVVAKGTGWFQRAGERVRFGMGDVLFAAAGEEHRFEDFSDDFGTWVIFYGPKGGEKA